MKKLLIFALTILIALSAAIPASATATRAIGTDYITFTDTVWTSKAISSNLRTSTNQGKVSITIPSHGVSKFRAGTKPTMEVQVYVQNGIHKRHIRTFYHYPLSYGTRIYTFNVDGMSANVYDKNVTMYALYRSNYLSSPSTIKPIWRD